ncbi:MAG: phenylacetate--CoA ligase family protein [Bacteroidetes bacterium]|nr:phenylacetate--CoA ligase family protein [Bacteroidota bacterium]MCW5897460.1 phenylacetate--CoA ligase family protein [Bacteroidota bacterium]
MLKLLYDNSPYPLRVLAASAYGLRVRQWRYGRKTTGLVDTALERDGWSADRWNAWQKDRLAYILHRAATKVPCYRAMWESRRRAGDNSSCEVLENWPVLKKETVRRNPAAFVADDCDADKMYREQTSGTTGTPLALLHSRETLRQWYALFDARVREWNGFSRNDRWAIIGGQLVAPVRQVRPPYWVWNAALKQLYLSAYHISARTVSDYFSALRTYRVRYILGYPSALAALAQHARRHGIPTPGIQLVISNAEPLYDYQRESIARGFGCPVRDTYGMAEYTCGASECTEGTMHLWPEAGVCEVLEDDADVPVLAGQSGRLIATGLLNSDMPLVRYEVGDRITLSDSSDCACGRCLPIIQSIEGRSDDAIVTPDGRSVGRLDPVFKADLPVIEAQIIQEEHDRLRVRIVPSAPFNGKHSSEIVRRLTERVGPMHIDVELVDRIERTKNGKFRAVISKVKNSPVHEFT